MESSDYAPPAMSDYDNVVELNLAWLSATSDLGKKQQQKLAKEPFLLFSLREQELDWWDRALAQQSDLLHLSGGTDNALRRLQCAALAFLWHLAKHNPYAVRIISGASIAWCDMLTSVPLVRLIHCVGDRSDLLAMRVRQHRGNESSSRFAALHGLLTRSRSEPYAPLRSAACNMPSTRMRVADDRARKKV